MNTNTLYYLLQKVRFQGTEENTFLELGFQPEECYYNNKGKFMFGYVSICDSKTMFTSHLDTVETHRVGLTKKVFLDPVTNQLFANNQVLGADDGAGVALLCHMIKEQVAGHYFFFAGEEIGGIGSSYLADNFDTLFPTLKLNRAIAFDRKGTSDVIVSQFCGTCCSDSFALALCKKLGTEYKPAQGSFTDTANFVSFILECTNVSVGYYNEHSKNEYLDLTYLQSLAKKVCEIDWERLPTSRVCYTFKDYRGMFTDDWMEDTCTDLEDDFIIRTEEYFNRFF
jgi:hypothetical protein